MARQRVLTVASAGGVVCSSVSETSSILSPAHTSHSMLGHSTPMSYTAPHSQPQTQDVSRLLATPSQYKILAVLKIYFIYRVVTMKIENVVFCFHLLEKRLSFLYNIEYNIYVEIMLDYFLFLLYADDTYTAYYAFL